jgi:hypothetical protein
MCSITKRPKSQRHLDTFLDSWNGRFLGRRDQWCIAVSRASLDMLIPRSSSMGSVLFSTTAPQPLGFPSPWHWLAGLCLLGRVELSVAQRGRGSGRSNATATEQVLSKRLGGIKLVAIAAKSHNSNQPPAGRKTNDQPKGTVMSLQGSGTRTRQWHAPATLPCIVRTGVLGNRVVNPVYHASKRPGAIQRYLRSPLAFLCRGCGLYK